MDPLVEEYNSKHGNRGTELAALKRAEAKTEAFASKCFYVTGSILAIEGVLRFLRPTLWSVDCINQLITLLELCPWVFFVMLSLLLIEYKHIAGDSSMEPIKPI